MSGRLTLTFNPGSGCEALSMVVPLDEQVCSEIRRIRPLKDTAFFGTSFDDVVEVLKRKEFRKHLFVAQAERLGTLLAERMEDAEGWHDASRMEPAKKELSGPA